MADEELLAVLRRGTEAWNAWKEQNFFVPADLSGADLSEARLPEADLRRVNLIGADLSKAYLNKANLSGADLSDANLSEANLGGATLAETNLARAKLSGAVLSEAYLNRANLSEVNLSEAFLIDADLPSADLAGANLSKACLSGVELFDANLREVNLIGADLSYAGLVRTNFTGADLTGCRVYGISAWDLKLDRAEQKSLIITERGEPEITVDNLEVAQFIYLLLNNERIRHVIDTITSKVVLILGRFTEERKAVLDALREELRQRDYTPVLFDFEKPASKDLTGTVQTLANMAGSSSPISRTPSSVPHELAMLVPSTVVPVQPVVLEGQREYAMFVDLKRRYPWVLEPFCYASPERLIANLSERVIVPAEAKARELRGVPPPT
jgi:uncharacterized protein YjbI with pentapeptide repeats